MRRGETGRGLPRKEPQATVDRAQPDRTFSGFGDPREDHGIGTRGHRESARRLSGDATGGQVKAVHLMRQVSIEPRNSMREAGSRFEKEIEPVKNRGANVPACSAGTGLLERTPMFLVRALLIASVLLVPLPARAGISVLSEAARTGDFGLRTEIRPVCPGEETYLVLGPVVVHQEVEACKDVVVGATVDSDGELVVQAGRRVAFLDGFSVAAGGELVAGTTGGWDPGFVVDDSAEGLTEVEVEWFASFDDSGMAPGQRIVILELNTDGDHEVLVWYEDGEAGGEVWLEVVESGNAVGVSTRQAVGPGWHGMEIHWRSSTLAAPVGVVELRVDGAGGGGVEVQSVPGLTVDRIRLGVTRSEQVGRWIDLDDYTVKVPI
jgi:hypothetical protein